MNIDTSLLREKFIINEKNAHQEARPLNLKCPSTRMAIELQSEEIIVRSYNMHSCVRMVAQIIAEHKKNGNIMSRQKKVGWTKLWSESLSPYDKIYNPNDWVAIYNKGKLAFSSGKYHQLFDVIEKCDAIGDAPYEDSIKLAKDYFAKAGTEIKMTYDSNVALVAVLSDNNGRCSVVLRGADKTTTFNYALRPIAAGRTLDIPQGLRHAASFLEAVQLSYIVRENNNKTNQGIIKQHNEKAKQAAKALERIELLDNKISTIEHLHDIQYRPERPNFSRIMARPRN